MRRSVVFACVCTLFVSLASVASAGNSESESSKATVKSLAQAAGGGTSAAADQYGSAEKGETAVTAKSKPKTVVAGASASSEQKPSSGALPFTGASLGWVVLAGALLVSFGVVLRTRGRRE